MKRLIKTTLRYCYFATKIQIRKKICFIKKHILFHQKYNQIKSFANMYKGERCFIIATGPSLTLSDVQKLKNEWTFGVNSIINMYNQTEWRPNFYVIQDIDVYNLLKNKINDKCADVIFYGDTISNLIFKNALPFYLDLQRHPLGDMSTKFSGFADRRIYDGNTVTYSAIQLAVYMGFKKIYLVGCDTNYSGSKTHFDNYIDKVDKSVVKCAYNAMVTAYQEAEKYTKEHNVKIYNATRGGMLEVFERVNLDDVICDKSANDLS